MASTSAGTLTRAPPEIQFTPQQAASLAWYLVVALEDCEMVGDGAPGRLMRKRDRAVVEAFRLGLRVGERAARA